MIARKVGAKIQELKKFYSVKYIRIIFFGLLASCFVVASYFGYRWRYTSKQRAAYMVFSDCMNVYNQGFQSADSKKLEEAAAMFDVGYKKHSGSSIAPFFILFQAKSLLENGKREKAIELMESGVKNLSTSSSLFFIYKNSLALMKIDSKDSSVSLVGVNSLQDLAYNKNNISRDMSLYYVGLYFDSQNDVEKSKKTFNDLVQLKSEKQFLQSPFVQMAEEKLKQLV